jgi:hypothetical protein
MLQVISTIILMLLVIVLFYLLYDCGKCDSDSFMCTSGDTKTCFPNKFKTEVKKSGICDN